MRMSKTDYYIEETKVEKQEFLIVKIAEIRCARSPAILATYGLGSCLAIALYDGKSKIGGLSHTMLPIGKEEVKKGKFVNSSIDRMLFEMDELGCCLKSVVAKLVGGAKMFSELRIDFNIGMRNIMTARKILDEKGIPVVGEDTGENFGRSLEFFLETGKIAVRSLKFKEHVLY